MISEACLLTGGGAGGMLLTIPYLRSHTMTVDITLLHPAVQAYLSSHAVTCRTLACDPALADTTAFCEQYGFAFEQAANAIIVIGKTTPIKYSCCLVLATCKLDVNKKVSELMGVKRCSFASADQTRVITGMEIGGVTPIGLPEMPIYIDARVMGEPEVVIGGGNRSSKILLCPAELVKLANASVVDDLGILR